MIIYGFEITFRLFELRLYHRDEFRSDPWLLLSRYRKYQMTDNFK